MLWFTKTSDDIKQDSATIDAHIKHTIELLKEPKLVWVNSSKILENTAGCAEKYICATALYLLSMFSHLHNITINRAVGVSVYGKDSVDGLNAIEIYVSIFMTKVQFVGSKGYEN